MSWIVGHFELIEPPQKLVYTWRLEPGPPRSDSPSEHERVTVHFEPHDGGTQVIVIHERIANPTARKMHEDGWIGCLDGLARFIAAP